MLRRRAPRFPLCAIAGIDANNAGDAIAAGADGIAVISALSRASDPQAAARELRDDRRCGAATKGSPMTAIAVTIAGSDSGGGAGIQADLKTFSALGVYGASVITALTAQNTKGVTAIHDAPAEFIAAQIDAVFSDLDVGAVKIGMVSQRAAIETIAAGLERWGQTKVVLDPVMIAASGDKLLAPDAVEVLKRLLMPRARARHAQSSGGGGIARGADRPQRGGDARARRSGCSRSGRAQCSIKGGHASGAESVDLLIEPTACTRLAADRASRP